MPLPLRRTPDTKLDVQDPVRVLRELGLPFVASEMNAQGPCVNVVGEQLFVAGANPEDRPTMVRAYRAALAEAS